MVWAVVVIVIIVVAGGVAYFLTVTPSPTTTTSTTSTLITSTPTITPITSTITTPTTSTTPALGPSNSSEIISIENEPPTSIDPASGFFVGEQEVMDNVYQGLLFYNYTNVAQYAPMLATSWVVSPNFMNYNFTLRQNAYFMNGEPLNASAFWFSINRVMIMNQAGVSYFTSILYNATTALATGYVVPVGVANALAANGYPLSSTNSTLRQVQAAKDLAAILNNFNPSNSTIQAIMSYPNQAVSVIDNYEVSFHLLSPYSSFFEVLSSPASMEIYSGFVDANGGVQPNTPNTYVETHSMGTGPYYVKSYTLGEVMVLQANPDYWAAKLTPSETNVMLTPPHVPVIILEYVVEASQMIQGIEDNKAQLLEGAPIPCLSPVYLSSVASAPGVRVVSFPNAVKFTYLMITLDTEKYPYNITNFRVALAHAINYSEIFSTVSGQYGVPYVGPISPGLPYYNPTNLPPYNYDPSLSISLLAKLGFQLSLPNGTTVNPSGPIFSPTLTYADDDPAELKIAQEMQVMYLQVGLNLNLDPVTDSQMYYSISLPGTNSGYPGMLEWYWFPDWPDGVYQDLFTQVNVLFGGIAGDVSWFNNTEVNSLTNNIAFQTNPSVINSSISQVYQVVYQQVPDIWLYAEVPYSVQATYLNGVIYNAGIQGYYFPLMYYG